MVVREVNLIVDLLYFEVSNLFLLFKSQLFHKSTKFILRLIINKNNSKKILFFDSKWARYMKKKTLKTRKLKSTEKQNWGKETHF